MTEERFSTKLETTEQIKEAETDYLKKRGVKRLGHREVFTIEETEKGVQICGGSAIRYYFDDKEPEEPASTRSCIDLPKEFLPELKRIIEGTLGETPKWVSPKRKKI